jgi:hypothetical protein
MKNTFPTLPTHNEVECFKCASTDLEEHSESGYAKGSYKRFCPACKMFTFYDVRKAA